MALRAESRRLGRMFGALVLAVTPIGAAQACSTSTDARDDADATVGEDGTTRPETAADGSPDGADADLRVDDPCSPLSEILEAGPDAPPDADLGCRYTLRCGLPAAAGFVIQGCELLKAPLDADGGDASLGCSIPANQGCVNGLYTPPSGGALTFECLDCFGGGGRRPVGLRRQRAPHARDAVGAYFARMAHDEAASVHAFVRMRDELARLGAPDALVDEAGRSARDEARHARLMGRWACASGARAVTARVRRAKSRELEAIARENAVEGCVAETFGALLLRWQAAHALEPSLRRMFARVAADETRHSALSWEVARWTEARLDAAGRERVRAARTRAVHALRARIHRHARDGANAPLSTIGRPTRAEALALFEGLVEHLGLG